MSVLLKKRLPEDFSADVVEVLGLMSLTDLRHLRLMGSGALKAQLYAGDYDAFEVVPVRSVASVVKTFQSRVRALMNRTSTYVGDIKSGMVAEWKVVEDEARIEQGNVRGYRPDLIKRRVETLFEDGIIGREERNKAMEMLKPRVTPSELLDIKRELRYHIVRWTPQEVLRGKKTLVDGRTFTLEEAFQTPTITKMDVVAWVQGNRFTDFSVIYEFRKGKTILNPAMVDIEQGLKENIYALYHEGDFYKMAKRMFALARILNAFPVLSLLSQLFNGDLGRLYVVYGDIGTLEFLLENEGQIPREKVQFEIDQFHNRLANVTLPKYLEDENEIASVLVRATNPTAYAQNHAQLLRLLRQLRKQLYSYLTSYSRQFLLANGMLPPPPPFLP